MSRDQLPALLTPIPGPESRRLAARLARVESPNITALTPQPPIFWQHAQAANVIDVDGNTYIDLTSGFGVANAGHSNHAVAAAVGAQALELAHALGDVHPAAIKVRLLERIAQIMPAGLEVTILGSSGAEAVEAALKTAALRTGRHGILAFDGAYHGLTYGALAVTQRAHFRASFEAQLFDGVRFAPFPNLQDDETFSAHIDAMLDETIGCIIVEPVQGRGGVRVPPDWFLRYLRERCDGRKRVLVFDEIYVGMGRTGHWLACEHWQVTPDIAVIGKGLSGALPLSAAVGTRAVMDVWPPSTGEAIHTSTFIGNPIACAAALAQIDEIAQRGLLKRASSLGQRIRQRTTRWQQDHDDIVDVRGLGLIQAVELKGRAHAQHVVDQCLQHGVLLLMEGADANVLAITPPSVITEAQLEHALDVIESALPFGH